MMKGYNWRIEEVAIANFRGFVNPEPVSICTDGDVVLLTGPNGFGKTSFIDALGILLNNYYYDVRKPLLSLPLENGYSNKEKEAIIEAKLKDPAERKQYILFVTIPYGKNKKIEPEPVWEIVLQNGLPPELAARCSFFYQDLLSKLFEEEENGAAVRIMDFLRPMPKAVDTVRNALSEASKTWQIRLQGLWKAESEKELSKSEIEEKRRVALDNFIHAWNKRFERQAREKGLKIPYNLPAGWLLLDGRELQTAWENRLQDFVSLAFELMFEKTFDKKQNQTPLKILRALEEALIVWQRQHLDRQKDFAGKLRMIVDGLPPEKRLLTKEECLQEESAIKAINNQLIEKEKLLVQYEQMEKYFSNPIGPELLDILQTLRDKGEEWLSHFDSISKSSSNMPPPYKVGEWLRYAVAEPGYNLHEIVSELETWQEKISHKRSQLINDISRQRQYIRERETLLKKSRDFHRLYEDPQMGSELAQLKSSPLMPLSFFELKTMLEKISPQNFSEVSKDTALRDALKTWVDIEELDEQRKRWEREKKQLDKTASLRDAVTKALKQESGKEATLNYATDPSEEIFGSIEKSANSFLEHFRLVNGITPVKITKRKGNTTMLEIKTSDGRPLSAFSTGQKAQLGLSMLLGLNYALHKYIGHSVIAFDDVTTALDMAQLPHIAALIRKIAYGADSGRVSSTCRQVFLVSHHEDLTNRLLDYLVPPAGKKMIVLNFVNWSPVSGPEIEQRKVVPALGVQGKELALFKNALRAVLGE